MKIFSYTVILRIASNAVYEHFAIQAFLKTPAFRSSQRVLESELLFLFYFFVSGRKNNKKNKSETPSVCCPRAGYFMTRSPPKK